MRQGGTQPSSGCPRLTELATNTGRSGWRGVARRYGTYELWHEGPAESFNAVGARARGLPTTSESVKAGMKNEEHDLTMSEANAFFLLNSIG